MAFLIVRIEPMINDTLKESEKEPVIEVLAQRARNAPVDHGDAKELLEKHGFELGPIVGPGSRQGYPLTGYCYVSPNKDGKGRGASSLHRWPVRRALDN